MMEWKAEKLMIKGQRYQQPVTEPKNADLIKMTVEQLDTIYAIKPVHGERIYKFSSSFLGYTLATHTYQQINNAYKKLRLLHGDARHIVCAFRIPGRVLHECESYCDGSEHGAGCVLLTWMRKKKIDTRRSIKR